MMNPSTFPAQVANADGLRDEDRQLVSELAKAWQDNQPKNLRRHAYYAMHNSLVDLGISIPPTLKHLNAACGWGKKCVDVMVEHSKFDGFTVADEQAQAQLDAVYRRNKLRTLYRKATTSALEQCFNLYFVTNEGGRAKVTAYPASASGCVWDFENNRLKAAMFVVSMSKALGSDHMEPDWLNVVTDTEVIRIRRIGGMWEATHEPHGLVHIPVFVAAYEATLLKPFGTSRITEEVMGYIDSAVRANVNEEIALAFAASPQKYLLGTDGDPFEDVGRWAAYIGNIFNIDATGDGIVPTFGQLPQPSMQPLVDHWRLLCGRMAGATGIHVSQFGQVHDNPASSDAIYAENEPLILKVKDWNEDVADVLVDVAIACIATERGTTFDAIEDEVLGIEARFRNPAMPTLAQQTDSAIKLASAVDGFAETDTFWETNGYGKEERDRIRRQLESVKAQRRADVALEAMFGVSADGENTV